MKGKLFIIASAVVVMFLFMAFASFLGDKSDHEDFKDEVWSELEESTNSEWYYADVESNLSDVAKDEYAFHSKDTKMEIYITEYEDSTVDVEHIDGEADSQFINRALGVIDRNYHTDFIE